jgi:hypothetical protein
MRARACEGGGGGRTRAQEPVPGAREAGWSWRCRWSLRGPAPPPTPPSPIAKP